MLCCLQDGYIDVLIVYCPYLHVCFLHVLVDQRVKTTGTVTEAQLSAGN